MIPLYTKRNISSIKLRFWSWPLKFVTVNPLPFALNIVVKDSLFVTCNIVLSLSWKKKCRYEYSVFINILSKIMRALAPGFHTFQKVWQIATESLFVCTDVKFKFSNTFAQIAFP